MIGLVPKRAVSFLIGDSHLGKSAFAYQLGLCVAAGIPFLGMPTEQGLVVYLDYENPLDDSKKLRDQLVRFLELPKVPSDFIVWSAYNPKNENGLALSLDSVCAGKPRLLIVDSLRSHKPDFEKGDHCSSEMNRLNDLARKYGVAILVIHHIRKPKTGDGNSVPPLDSDTPLRLWLNEAAGHRAITNLSHTRIAVDGPDRRNSKAEAAALVLRWHQRLRNDAGPVYLERVYDGDGEELGYRRIANVELLGKAEQIDAFKKLPQQFTFGQAMTLYDRANDPTRKFLMKCIELGLIRQTGRGQYERLVGAV